MDFDCTEVMKEIEAVKKNLSALVNLLGTHPMSELEKDIDEIVTAAFLAKQSIIAAVLRNVKPVLPDRY